MKRILAFVGASLMSAGISSAQGPTNPTEVLAKVIAQAQLCKHKTLKIALDDKGEESGVWVEPDKNRDVLAKLASGDKNYTRPLKHLRSSVVIDSATQSSMRIEAELTEELPYSRLLFTYFKLQELKMSLEQKLQGERWLPSTFELTIKYWAGLIGLGMTSHDKYKAKFDCSSIMAIN